MNRYREVLLGFLTIVALALGVEALRLMHELRVVVTRMDQTNERVRHLVETYDTVLSSEKSQKALEASLAAAASWQATARLVNTQVVPAATQAIKDVSASVTSVQHLTTNVDGEVARTGKTIREAIDSQDKNLTQTLSKVDEAVKVVGEKVDLIGQTVNANVNLIGTRTYLAVDQVNEATKKAQVVVDQLGVSAQHFSIITANLEQASQSMPNIAKGLEKVAGRAPTYQKIGTILAIGLGIANILK